MREGGREGARKIWREREGERQMFLSCSAMLLCVVCRGSLGAPHPRGSPRSPLSWYFCLRASHPNPLLSSQPCTYLCPPPPPPAHHPPPSAPPSTRRCLGLCARRLATSLARATERSSACGAARWRWRRERGTRRRRRGGEGEGETGTGGRGERGGNTCDSG